MPAWQPGWVQPRPLQFGGSYGDSATARGEVDSWESCASPECSGRSSETPHDTNISWTQHSSHAWLLSAMRVTDHSPYTGWLGWATGLAMGTCGPGQCPQLYARTVTPVSMRATVFLCLFTACAGAAEPGTPSVRPALIVGTTGDFPPFTLRTSAGYVGIDIDLARDLGRYLDRSVDFVETSWGSLVPDALAGRFDLALSAVSITDVRRPLVDFSVPYGEEVRVLVLRCEEQTRFSSLDQLDRPDVTVLVRGGGAVESYIRQRLPLSRIVPSRDVEAMYARLEAGDGDAIVATIYDVRRFPELCVGLNGAQFFATPLAVMLPKDSPLTESVNRWLRGRIEDGTVGRLMRHYGATSREQPSRGGSR